MKYLTGKFEKKPVFRVSVEGNIGCGKTTLMNYLAGFPEVDAHAEPISKWRDVRGHNMLDLHYKDMKRWNFTFSHYVQLTRLDIQTQTTTKNVQVFERSLHSNRHVFVEMAHEAGLQQDAEYEILCQWFDWMEKNIDISLDLIVYLRSTPEIVYDRIQRRNRREEAGITLDYLKQVHKFHEKWLIDSKNTLVPVLQINVDHELSRVRELYLENESYILGQTQLIM